MRLILLATLSLFLFQSCFHREGKITLLSESEPLTVKVDPGTEVIIIDWVWFQGPFRNKFANVPDPPLPTPPKEVVVWQISPGANSEYHLSPDKLPVLTYGQVPEGWTQQLPLTGLPAPLIEGYVYTVNAVTFRGPQPRELCVYVKNGRLEKYIEDGEGRLCKEY